MKTSSNGRKFIAKEEGNILYAYDDATEKRVPAGGVTRGTITIGVGHTSAAGEPKVVPGMTITAEQSDQILASDLGKVEKQVSNLVKVPLNQNQFDALVSFQFNTGGLGKSSALRALNARDYQGAADALLKWSKANGNQTLLLPRRQRERTLFLTTDATPFVTPKTSSIPVTSTSAPVTTAVVAGTAGTVVVSSYWDLFLQHWIMYTVGALALACAVDVLIHIYRKKTNELAK